MNASDCPSLSSSLSLINEWMQENQQPGDQISTSRNNMHWQQNLLIKERYRTALPILGMFYVLYLSKWEIFGDGKSWVINFGKSSACAGCSSDCVSFFLSPVAPENQMLRNKALRGSCLFLSILILVWFLHCISCNDGSFSSLLLLLLQLLLMNRALKA